MAHVRISEIESCFYGIYNFVQKRETIILRTTGGVAFSVTAKTTLDGRQFLALPHSNRVYCNDWGYRINSMGNDGQRIGQHCLPLHRMFKRIYG